MQKVNPTRSALAHLRLPNELLDYLEQLRLRTGGSQDFIDSLTDSTQAEDSRKFTELRQLTKKVAQMSIELERLQAENTQLKRLEARIKHLELE